MNTPNPWHTIPTRSATIFLLAVFCIFASLGIAGDVMSMGHQSPAHYLASVLLSALFAVGYAASGMSLRGRFWKAFIPLFLLQFLINVAIANLFPTTPSPTQLGSSELARLQGRLLFDGFAIIASIGLGYTGFVYVSVSEGRRHIRAQTEKALLQGEMSAAREVQRIMVSEDFPAVDGYSIECVYRPAAEVGGDFFQILPLKSGRTLVAIGDVSGKGLPAAMIVSMMVGALGTISAHTEEPADILSELNQRLCGRMHGGFATCLIARLQEQGTLTLANAGHLPPYRNGSEVLSSGSLPLGLAETAAYQQTTLNMAVGDEFVAMTDGVAEAHNAQHALFGFGRVESMLSAGATVKSLADTAQQYGQEDDITVLGVARLA